MSDSGEFQEVESNFCGKKTLLVPIQPALVPSPRSMLSCDKRLPLDTWNLSGLQENVVLSMHVLVSSHHRNFIKAFFTLRHQVFQCR